MHVQVNRVGAHLERPDIGYTGKGLLEIRLIQLCTVDWEFDHRTSSDYEGVWPARLDGSCIVQRERSEEDIEKGEVFPIALCIWAYNGFLEANLGEYTSNAEGVYAKGPRQSYRTVSKRQSL